MVERKRLGPRLRTRKPNRLCTRETNSVVHADAGVLKMLMTVMVVMVMMMMMMMHSRTVGTMCLSVSNAHQWSGIDPALLRVSALLLSPRGLCSDVLGFQLCCVFMSVVLHFCYIKRDG